MLQISDMDGAVILTFSEPLTPKERGLLKEARKTETEQKGKVIGAGGICWGDCAKKKDDYWEKRSVPQQDTSKLSDDLSDFVELYNPEADDSSGDGSNYDVPF